MKRLNSPEDIKDIKEAIIADHQKKPFTITICSGTGCITSGSAELAEAFNEEIRKKGLYEIVELRKTGCHGFCERGPITVILPQNICYLQPKPEDVPEILARTIVGNEIVERLLYQDPHTGEKISRMEDIPFYKYQKRVLLTSNTLIDPKEIRDYLGIDGYSALAKVLTEMNQDDVIGIIKDTNLRGRGGGGFHIPPERKGLTGLFSTGTAFMGWRIFPSSRTARLL